MCKKVYPSLGIIQILAKLTYGCFCFSSIMEHPERFRSRGLLGKSRHGVNVHCPCSRPSASLLVDGLELLQNQKTSCADERISCHVSREHLLLQLSPELRVGRTASGPRWRLTPVNPHLPLRTVVAACLKRPRYSFLLMFIHWRCLRKWEMILREKRNEGGKEEKHRLATP